MYRFLEFSIFVTVQPYECTGSQNMSACFLNGHLYIRAKRPQIKTVASATMHVVRFCMARAELLQFFRFFHFLKNT